MTELATVKNPKTILVVEPSTELRDAYMRTLRQHGYRVVAVSTIREAEHVVNALTPDVVVLDCDLPDGDGLDLVNRWRDRKMERVPVVVVTADGERANMAAALLVGADVFVPKPCGGSVLAAYVDRAIHTSVPTRRMRAVAL